LSKRLKYTDITHLEITAVPTITLIEHSGQSHTIDAETGKSLMLNAIDNAVPGIDADCGGAAACGTCHCFVEEEWRPATGDVGPLEEAMLGMRPDRAENSRLSCQIDISDGMDGLVVRLPEYQM
jgi:2Fe-2S ferredoxin